jgi:hypothetical protein
MKIGMLRETGAFFMPDDKKDNGTPLGQGGTGDAARETLLKVILAEMETMIPEELERLYAAVALMEDEQGKGRQGKRVKKKKTV